jgi:hypothetical protein
MELAIKVVGIVGGIAILWLTTFFMGIYIDVLSPCKRHNHKHTVLENASIATVVLWVTLVIVLLQFYWDA